MRKTKPKPPKHLRIQLLGGPFNRQVLKMSDDTTLVFRIRNGEYGYYKKKSAYYNTAHWIPITKGL